MRRFVLSTALLVLAAAGAARANFPFLASEPGQLQLVDVGEGYRYGTEQLQSRFDILDAIRRQAGDRLMKGWGVGKSPAKAPLMFGVVATTSSDALEFVVVLKGDALDPGLLKSRMIEKYGNHWRRHKKEAAPREVQLKDGTATVLPYMDRKGELVLAVVNEHLLFASVLPGHYELLEGTAAVVADPEHKAEPPASLQLSYKGYLTTEERVRVKEFFERTITGRVATFRKNFEKLYQGLQSDEFQAEEFKTANEKLNDLFLKLVDWSMDVQYARGPDGGDDVYKVTYAVTLPTAEEAQAMKELLLEKVVFYKENAKNQATTGALEGLSFDAADRTVTVRAELDTQKGVYDFATAYFAFLMSYTQADRYLGLK